MSESFLKRALRSRTAKALGIIIFFGVIFAPNGFFSGHRTVILEAEVSIIEPTVHLHGDEISTSATLTGRVVTSTDMPISGATVTAFNDKKTRRTTGYTDPDGSYRLPIAYTGALSVRVRTPYFADVVQDVDVSDGETIHLNFVATRMTDEENLSNALAASAHAATIHWPNADDRETFVSRCVISAIRSAIH